MQSVSCPNFVFTKYNSYTTNPLMGGWIYITFNYTQFSYTSRSSNRMNGPRPHSREYPCKYEILKFSANSPTMILLARRNNGKNEALQMVTNACTFLTNALANIANETNTQHMRGELHIHPLPMFHFVTYTPATAEILANITNAYKYPC
jgi:hypothetical protein